MLLDDRQIQRIKEIEIDMLSEFIRICEKLHLRYYLIGGTLLGAIRHKGFIPWDDDIDIGMPREDYEIFIEKAAELLPDYLFLQNYKIDKYMIFPFAKIRNNNTTYVENRSKNSHMHQGVWIDIFPLDYYERNKMRRMINNVQVTLINLRIAEEENLEIRSNCSILHKIIKHVCTKAIRLRYPKLQNAVKRIDDIYSSCRKGNIVVNNSGAYPGKEAIPLEWFGDGVFVEFEKMKLRAPVQYDKYLSHIYGDYMTLPPINKQKSVHDIEIIDLDNSYKKYFK